jgi:hypothetical protein
MFKIAPVELANPESGTPSACRPATQSAASPAEYAAPFALATGCAPAGETPTPPTSSDRGLTQRSQSATWSFKPTTGTLKEIHLTPT